MKKLKKILIWILSSVFAAIIAYMVWKYIDSLGGLCRLLIYFRDLLLILINTPTPLWATTALVLVLGVYIYIKTSKIHSSEPPHNKNKTKRITVDKLKWVTIIEPTGKFKIKRTPLCEKHGLEFNRKGTKWYCPKELDRECNNTMDEEKLSELKKKAESIIEYKIRHNDY